MTPDHMTGAELQTLREACGLSREELATAAGVQARTIKHWENGRAGVPADVATLVQLLDNEIDRQALRLSLRRNSHGPVLVRYSSAEDLARYSGEARPYPLGAHGASIVRARQLMQGNAHSLTPACAVRVVWLRPEAYEAWHQGTGTSEPLHAYRPQYLWAVEQLSAQAIPHKADQPPADGQS
jgi:DNA-binding XRE family transcriptional regulator